VDSRSGQWDHRDWLMLLGNLRHTEFWPMDLEQIGAVLEALKREKTNLRRWLDSGQARLWVESHRGRWGHADWLALLEMLRQSELWPVQPEAVGRVLEGLRRQWWNLRLWEDSGQPRHWVEAHGGAWGHDDWLALVDALQQSEFWPLDLAAAGAVLEGLKERYWNLRRWRESGQAQRWVESQRGAWCHAEWLEFMNRLRQSEFWPLQPGAVGRVLEELRTEWRNLRRWQESGGPQFWVSARGGRWEYDDWLALLEDLRRSDFWPLPADAVGRVLEALKPRPAAARPAPRELLPVPGRRDVRPAAPRAA
jgi:hypothetical protein